MLRRSQRLSTRQFNEVIKNGRASHSALFLVRATDAVDGATRVAAVAPVKIAKTAVLRNNTRRKIYEALRPLLGDVGKPLHIIVIAKASALKASLAELVADTRSIFVKARFLR